MTVNKKKAAMLLRRLLFILLPVSALALFTIFGPLRCATVWAQDFYWEEAQRLSRGSAAFPQALEAGLPNDRRTVAVWQEFEQQGEDGQAWLSLASWGRAGIEKKNRFAGPFGYGGTVPVLFSLANDQRGSLAIAVSSGSRSVSVYRSADGGISFFPPSTITLDTAVVSPRIFARTGGGWYVFLTQGSEAALSLSIVYTYSADGITWEPVKPFLAEGTSLVLNVLPSAASYKGVDYVAFQSLVGEGEEKPSFQLFMCKTGDGGASWSQPAKITTFADTVQKNRQNPYEFDNQRAHMQVIGDNLWLSWERRLISEPNAQIYSARLDEAGLVINNSAERITLGQGKCSEPRMFEAAGNPGVSWFDDRRGENRVFMAIREGALWRETDLSGRSRSSGTFGRTVYAKNGLYAFWQTGKENSSAVLALVPDTSVQAPALTPVDFTAGVRARKDKAQVRWAVPGDSSGILGFSWIWSRSETREPPETASINENVTLATNTALEDGSWYFAIKAQDYAGNWSKTTRVEFVRDTSPPGAPVPSEPETGVDGFLLSNTFALSWAPPKEVDVDGYSWSFEFLGALDRLPPRKLAKIPTAPGSAAASSGAASGAARQVEPYAFLPVTDYEKTVWVRGENSKVPPTLRTRGTSASFQNIEDGYYIFTVAAIDLVGNIGESARFIVRADKFRPFTAVYDVTSSPDDFGTLKFKVIGRGFADDGIITRIVIDADGKEPYERDYNLSNRDFMITNDRLAEGLVAADLPQGSYRIGIFHPLRGWFFTQPVVKADVSGTVKFGSRGESWKPAWVFNPSPVQAVSISTLFMLLALLFPFAGFSLSLRALANVARESRTLRLDAQAILEGKPMSQTEKEQVSKSMVRRGAGLSAKFAVTISLLVLFVVALVSIPLALQMVQAQSSALARSLEKQARVLLESVAQGGRSYLPSLNVLELSLLPNQAAAMPEARYVTITGFPASGNISPDSVWATNDPDIHKKTDGSSLTSGVSILTDELTPRIGAIARETDAKANEEVAELSAMIQQLTEEGKTLATKLDATSQDRLTQLSASARDLERELGKRLGAIAESAVSSEPAFDPKKLGLQAKSYIFYKPILYRKGLEPVYYRGMVRLAVSTEKIVAEVLMARETLFRSIAIIVAIALGIGVLSSFILSSIIINPIRRLVKGIETIRDTEDKKKLAEFTIDVNTKDELSLLANTINQMTAGLVHAAQEAEMLTVGKEVQKMFIPLITNATGEKLTTGFQQNPTHSFYGYYEGAKGVSGDYFDFVKLDERFWAFIKCDVSGKGIPAALIMVGVATIFATEFQGWSYAKDGIKLDKITYKINDFIDKRGFKGRFAAFIMGVYDSKTGNAYLCHAGDNLVRIYSSSKKELITLELPSSPTAGTFSNDLVEMKAPFRQVIQKLEVGDTLLLYTDGFEESTRAQRGPDFKQVIEAKMMTDREGKETKHMEPMVEHMDPERIKDITDAIMTKGSYSLKKEMDPLGKDMSYQFDFSDCSGGVEDLVLGLAALEKVFRMIPDPRLGPNDQVIVDAKIDAFLEKHFSQYREFCSHKKPHPDPHRQEYLYYTHMKEDDQYDDLTMMVIRRDK